MGEGRPGILERLGRLGRQGGRGGLQLQGRLEGVLRPRCRGRWVGLGWAAGGLHAEVGRVRGSCRGQLQAGEGRGQQGG